MYIYLIYKKKHFDICFQMAEEQNIEQQTQQQINTEDVNTNGNNVVEKTTNNIEDTATTTQTAPEKEVDKKTLEEILAEHGYTEEINVIKQHREAKVKEQIEKEKPYQETKEFADIVKYASENKLATLEDFKTFDEIKTKKDKDIAFEIFKKEYTPDEFESEFSEDELNNIIQEKFEEKYHLNSDDETLKELGVKKLSEIAEKVRKPFVEKIETVQNSIIANQMYKSHLTAIEEFNKNIHKQSITIKDGDGEDINIEVENTDIIDPKEIQKILKDTDEGRLVLNTLFETYKKDKSKADEAFGQFISNIHNKNSQQKILESIANSAYEKGLEKGKSMGVGHIAPFNSKKIENDITINNKTAKINNYDGNY